MTFLPRAEKLGWARNPKFLKYSKELHEYLIDSCICEMRCPDGREGECCFGCANLGEKGCVLKRQDMPFECLSYVCKYAWRLLNDTNQHNTCSN